MKFLHISDLHFGKIMNEVSLIESDQPYWVEKFIETVEETKADAVVIAGDIYDRSSPSADAVRLLDSMITKLADKNIYVLIVAGNHDSGQKLSFASEILKHNNIYISGILSSEEIPHVTLNDEYGEVTFWLVPYIFPGLVNDILKTDYRDYDTAFRALLDKQDIDFSKRNVIVAHQNVVRNGVEAERSGSESMVAGVGGIEYTAFEKFEYTALGHIHANQKVGKRNIIYAGSPLCYHFDEVKFSKKGPMLVELKEKDIEADIKMIPIEPLHKVNIIKNTYDAIFLSEMSENEYIKVIVTDKKITPEVADKLRYHIESNGSQMLEIISTYGLTNADASNNNGVSSVAGKSVFDLFAEFYGYQNSNAAPDENEKNVILKAIELMDIAETEDIAGKIVEFTINQEDTV